MGLIHHIDPVERRIYLSQETVDASIHPIDIYKEMRTLRRTDETLRPYDVFLKAYGNVPKGSGKYTERYVVCINGTKIVPYDTSQILTITGTIITDDGYEGVYCFDRSKLSPGIEVDINYVPPQVEVIQIGQQEVLTKLDTIEAKIDEILDIEEGNWKISNNQMIFYSRNGNELMRFNLFNKVGTPSETDVYSRERV